MMDALRRLFRDGEFASFVAFRDPQGFDRLMQKLARHRWVVYAKRPFASCDHVLRYLGRYTHRVGTANSRLWEVDADHVCFATKEGRSTSVDPVEFLHRLVQHILPPGFVKIRHYGLYAAVNVRRQLMRAGALLPAPTPVAPLASTWYELLLALTGEDVATCPQCGADVRAHPLEAPTPVCRGSPPP